MRFISIAAIFSSLLVIPGALATVTPAQVITSIKTVTQISMTLDNSLGSLTTAATYNTVKGMSVQTEQGFRSIIYDLYNFVAAAKGTPAFVDADAEAIVVVLTTFVEVHQALLNTVIGKHSIFAQFGLTAPITAVLRTLESNIDGFAFLMIGLIPTRKSAVMGGQSILDTSVKMSISTYAEFCIPSFNYPTVLPSCLISE